MQEQLEIRATQFNKDEMNRILGVLKETDPRSRDYVQVLDSFERFLYFGNVIAAAQDLVSGFQDPPTYIVSEPDEDNIVQFSPPVAEDEKFEPVSTDTIADESTDYKDVRIDPEVVKARVKARMTRARAEGKVTKIKPWMEENFGVEGFSDIPADQYPKVMALLDELGVS